MTAIGIDLGTTNSCVCVLEETGLRILGDGQGNPTIPSVVFVGRDGKRQVGHAARNRIGSVPPPVTTIKRKMGSTETVHLGGEEKTPVEVSAMILSYLKEMAARQLGRKVDRAVVTVPAYFSHAQRQQTDEAARLAGFRQTVTLLEPVAAALAHSLASDRDRLRVFVYDLGGGTFDATVLEKDPHGGITVLSFGGDPFLGGDDVDQRLARLLLRQLGEVGYRLDFDLDDPADFCRFLHLKSFAELAKKELSHAQEVELVRQGLFEDQAGELVDLDLTLTRRQLEECAEDLIQRTVDASLATLAKQEIALESIDEVVMVGGMSRMPLVRRKLIDAFDREPRDVDPDLIVAQGAAIKAAEVFGEQTVSKTGLELELRYDRHTNRERVRISGVFDRPLNGHTVYLMSEGQESFQELDAADRFTFEDVSLVPESENLFTLSVEDAEETAVLEREFRIVHERSANRLLASPGSVVTKPISVRTLEGLRELFAENTALPYTACHSFETADRSGKIVAPIYEGHHEVARLLIDDLPPDLQLGTLVDVEVTVKSDYTIDAVARVPDLRREVAIRFRIEAIDTSQITPEFVRRKLAELDQQAETAAADCRSPEALEKFRLRYALLQDEIEVELGEMEPKRAKLHEKLGEISHLIDSLTPPPDGVELRPSFEQWSERLGEIVSRAIDLGHPKLPEVRPQLDLLRRHAREVWERKDPIAWKRVNEQLAAVAGLLEPEIPPEVKALGMTAWLLTEQLPELRKASGGQYASELEALESECLEVLLQTKLGVLEASAAIHRVIDLYRRRVEPIRQQLGLSSLVQPKLADPAAVEGLLRTQS